jgi:DNA-binding PucR family transcriptional regulator
VALSDLPDLSTASGKTFPDVDENQIMEYTAQLKDWIGKLQLGSRIVPPSPPTENRPLRPQDGQPWTWEHIKESFTELERSAENVAEQIYIKKFTHMMDIMDPNEKIAALLDAHRKREHGEAALAADVLLRNVDEVGNELGKQAMLAAQLFLKVQHNEEELEKLRDEKRQRDAMKSSVSSHSFRGKYPLDVPAVDRGLLQEI